MPTWMRRNAARPILSNEIGPMFSLPNDNIEEESDDPRNDNEDLELDEEGMESSKTSSEMDSIFDTEGEVNLEDECQLTEEADYESDWSEANAILH